MYDISSNVDDRLLHFRLTGLWDEEDARRFEQEIETEISKLSAGGRPFAVLADLTDYPAQFQGVAAIHQRIMGKLREGGMHQAATIVSALMTKMQINRLKPSETHQFFTSEAAAREWLQA